jgi:hypothetical protein
MLRVLVPQACLERRVALPELTLVALEALDVPDTPGHRVVASEKELEEELVAESLAARRFRQPGRERATPPLGDRVGAPVRPPSSALDARSHEPLVEQTDEHGVDLPVALGPEMRDAPLDPAFQVVAGSRPEREHAEERDALVGCICLPDLPETSSRPEAPSRSPVVSGGVRAGPPS